MLSSPFYFIRNDICFSRGKKKFQSVAAREADRRRISPQIKKDAYYPNLRDEMSPLGLLRRMTSKFADSQTLVLPRDNPRAAHIAPLYPTFFSVEAAAQEHSNSDREETVLLAIIKVQSQGAISRSLRV